jgi:D-3-phosphoglycerate dehydrogenase
VLTPHIGGATYNTEANHARMIVADIEAVLGGKQPVNCVNPEVLEGR